MEETPKENVGFSLLNEPPITINNDEAEEAENEQDQLRRQQELQTMLANAFDDIACDDENSTLNSSFNESHHILLSGGDRNFEEQYREATFNSLEQLQILYQVQVREIQKLQKDLGQMKEEREKEKTLLKRKNLLLEGDLEGCRFSLQQAQELIIEKSNDIEDYLKDIEYMKNSVQSLRNEKGIMEEELQLWKNKGSELEQKLSLIEKGLYVPVSEKQVRSKYESEISELQTNLEQTQKGLEQYKKDKALLENELKDLKQSHEFTLMEKEEEVHKLFSQLENTKFQCHNLTDKIGYLEKEHQNLTVLLNSTKKEVDVTVPESSGTVKILQQELKRCLDEQKCKRDELVTLEKELHEYKTKEMESIRKYKKMEDVIKQLKEDNRNIINEKQELSTQIQSLQKQVDNLNKRIQEDFELDKLKLANIEEENGILKKLTDDLEEQLIAIENKSDTNENEILQIQYSEIQKRLKDTEINSEMWKTQLEKYERLCLELQETCAEQKRNLYESQTKITELESKLVLKEKRDELIEDLQQKALMFEQYIKSKSEMVLTDKETNTDFPEILPQNEEGVQILLKEKIEKISFLLSENKSLKDKVLFDRKALNELTDVWNAEINRLNTLVRDLKQELDLKNSTYLKKQETLNADLSRMTTIVTKLAENLKIKEQYIKECQNKESKNVKEYQAKKERLKNELMSREKQMLLEQVQLKNECRKKEESLESKLREIQRNYTDGLLKVQKKLGENAKMVEEKGHLEGKIIEAYYDLMIQKAKELKPVKNQE